MRSSVLTIIVLFALLSPCKAQQVKTLTFQWKVNTSAKEDAHLFQNNNLGSILLGENTQQISFSTTPLQPIKYTLPKGAIFCRMEDALYKHFNVLIKVRMGTDDRYSN